MADDAERRLAAPEYSEPVMTKAADGTVTADWSRKGYRGMTLVSDQIIDEWVATINANVALRVALSALVDATRLAQYGNEGIAAARLAAAAALGEQTQ